MGWGFVFRSDIAPGVLLAAKYPQIIIIYGVEGVWVQLLGGGGPCSCYTCFTGMYLECACGLACPPNLWRYRLSGFSASGVLSSWFHPGSLPPVSLEWGGWAKTHHFLFTPTFPYFHFFPLLNSNFLIFEVRTCLFFTILVFNKLFYIFSFLVMFGLFWLLYFFPWRVFFSIICCTISIVYLFIFLISLI